MGKETTNIVSGFHTTFVRLSSYQVIDAVLLFVGEIERIGLMGENTVFGWKKKKDSLRVAAKIVQLVFLLWRSSFVGVIDALKMESE